MASEDSDSDSLPDLTEIFKRKKKPLSVGDIVFAKFKHLYWPALVRALYPNKNKVSIWYCDEPGKTYMLPTKNIVEFSDQEACTRIYEDIKKAGVVREHDSLTVHAKHFMDRRKHGYKDDPMKFFEQTYPFFLVEKMLENDPNINDSGDIKTSPMNISKEKKETIRQKLRCNNNESDDSDLECEDDSESNKDNSDYISEVNAQLQEYTRGSLEEIDVDEIIDYILAGKAEDYLQKIKSKKIPSEHQNLFEQSIRNRGKNTKEVSFTGPINEDIKLRKLISYLLPLYEKLDNVRKGSSISSGISKTAIVFQSNSKIRNQYVSAVFLPESIIFAISKIKNVSLDEAKKLFFRKSECKIKEIENILATYDPVNLEEDAISFISKSVKSVLEDKKQDAHLKHSADTSVCPVKKMCFGKSDMVVDDPSVFTPVDTSVCSPVKKMCIGKSDMVLDENLKSEKNVVE